MSEKRQVRVKPGVNHLVLLASDVDRTTTFYRNLLGFEEAGRRFTGLLNVELETGSVPLEQSITRSPALARNRALARSPPRLTGAPASWESAGFIFA